MDGVFQASRDHISARSDGVSLFGGMRVDFLRDGRAHSVTPAFSLDAPIRYEDYVDGCTRFFEAECREDGLLIRRQLALDPDAPLLARARMLLKNETGTDIWLDRMTLLEAENACSLFPGVDSRDWIVMRQGRMKNDLPAVCRLGDDGAAFTDMVGELLETGGMGNDGAPARTIVSDDVTILRSGSSNEAAAVLLGFMTGDDLLFETVLDLDGAHRCAGLRCACLYDALLPDGAEAESEWLRIDLTPDSFAALDCYAADKASAGHARVKRAPSVFCTWYYYGLSVTEEDMMSDMEELTRRQIPFDVFQLDEGWERTLGDWRLNGKFTMSHREIAETMRAHGFMPGIWTSPFIAHETAPVTSEHPDWLLRHRDGSLCLFPMNGTVYRVLDITNPEAVRWIEELYVYLRRCGFVYHKLDFTRAPIIEEDAVFHDPTMPRARAYRNAIQAVRRGIGEDGYLLICGGLYDPVIGLADGQRAGSDVLSMWSDPFKQGGMAAPFTIKQAILRGFMNAWWNNDPDALMVRRQTVPERGLALTYGLLNDEEVKTSALNQYFGGGLVCATEPMKRIEDDRLSVLRHILPPVPVKVTARDLFSGARYPRVLDAVIQNGGWHTVAVVNWAEETWRPVLTLDESLAGGLSREKRYRVCEFFSGMIREGLRCGDPIDAPAIAPHGSILLKIEEEDPEKPSVVGSSVHFSFGAELKRLEVRANTLFFEADYPFEWPAVYTVALPEGLHCAVLPPCCAVMNGRLTIHLPGRGEYRIQVPLKARGKLVSL